MFTIESSEIYKIRRQLIHQYQEQQNELDVVFKCSDGEQRCSRLVLNLVSQFYTEQLEGRDRLGNKAEFNYDFSKECVKAFLDCIHGIKVEGLTLVTLVEMMKFLKYEGKNTSDFEKDLLNRLHNKLKVTKLLTFDVKLLVCVVSKSFFNPTVSFITTFFEYCSKDLLRIKCFDLDMTRETNQKLKNLMGKITDKQIESEVFQKAKHYEQYIGNGTKVFNTSMNKEMEEYAIDCAKRAENRNNTGKSLANFIGVDFDTKYGGDWQCIEGVKHYYINKFRYIHLNAGKHGDVLLFQPQATDSDDGENSNN